MTCVVAVAVVVVLIQVAIEEYKYTNHFCRVALRPRFEPMTLP